MKKANKMKNTDNLTSFASNVKHSPVALRLRQLREQKGYSIAAAAIKSRVPAEIIFDYENDKVTPKIKHLKKLAICYEVTLEKIFKSE